MFHRLASLTLLDQRYWEGLEAVRPKSSKRNPKASSSGVLESLLGQGESRRQPFQGGDPTRVVGEPNVAEWTSMAEDLDRRHTTTRRDARSVCHRMEDNNQRNGAQSADHSTSCH